MCIEKCSIMSAGHISVAQILALALIAKKTFNFDSISEYYDLRHDVSAYSSFFAYISICRRVNSPPGQLSSNTQVATTCNAMSAFHIHNDERW